MKSQQNNEKNEEELRKFKYIFSISEELMSFIGPDYSYQDVNEAYLNAHNKKREDIVDHTIAELHGEDVFINIIKENIDRCFTGEIIKFEDWFKLDGAGRVFMEVTYYPCKPVENAKVNCVAVVARDITAKKLYTEYKGHAESELKESQVSLKRAQKLANIGSWDWDLTTDTVKFSDEYFHLFGFASNESATREQCLNRIHPDDLEAVNKAVADALEGAAHYSIEYRINLPGGQQKYVHGMGIAERDQNNKPVRFVGTVHDITEQKLAEERLISAVAFNKEVISSSPIGISIYNESGQCIEANTSIAKMVGATREQALAQNYNEIESWKKSGLLDTAKKSIRQQAKQRQEINLVTSFGKHASYDCSFMPFQLHGKQHLLLMVDDITERKQAEELLLQSQQQLNEAQRIAKVGSWTLDLRSNKLEWSDEIFHLFEIEKHLFDASYDDFLDAIHPDDREMVNRAYTTSVENHQPYEITHRLLFPDGRIKHVREACETLYDVEGLPFLSRGTVQDITQYKHAEEALQKSEERYRSLVESTDEWICTIDTNGILTYSNPSITRILGYKPEEIIGKECLPLLHEDDQPQALQAIPGHINTKTGWKGWILRWRHKDGGYRYIESNATPILNDSSEVIGFHGIARDKTEQLQAEREIELAKKEWNYAMDFLDEPVYLLDLERRLVRANQAFYKLAHSSESEAIGHHISDILHPDEEEVFCAVCQLHEEERDAVITLEADHPDNPVGMPIEVICKVIDDQDDQPSGILMTIRDLSRTRETNEMLRQSQAVFDSTTEGILITDTSLNIVAINPAFTNITGYSAEEVMGENPSILKSLAQEPIFYKTMLETIHDGKTWHGSLIDRKKDGSYYPILMTIVPIQDEERQTTHYLATQKDMTEHQRLEEQFQQAQKMEAIGTLVGGIAHDFNNTLGGIMGNVHFAKQRAGQNEHLIKNIDAIDKLCIRASEIVKQLLIFARRDKIQMVEFSFTDFLKDGILLALTSIPEDVDMELDIDPEKLFIKGNTTQIQQIILNLLINARDAIENTKIPKIVCSLHPYYADDAFKKQHPETGSDSFALFSIRDNGEGLRKEIIDKIFEPFFTTKEIDKGTGLGLAMVYGAIKSHNGLIEVDSEIGEGTVINIYLPLVKPVTEVLAAAEVTPAKANGELILVADDNSVLRMITEEALLDMGYGVITAIDGEDALNLYEKHINEITLVILDVVMPKMNGVDTALKMRLFNNNLPIIFTTGYDKVEALKDQKDIENSIVLSKPFPPEKLNHSIASLLEVM